MKGYVKEYLHRGAIFGGLGPVVLGIVYAVLEMTIDGFALGGSEVLLAIVSTYAIAFVQAGASVFNQIEEWSVMRALACHFLSVYAVYVAAYALNSWIPFEWGVIGVFTAIFVVAYAVIWVIVYASVKAASRKMSSRLV